MSIVHLRRLPLRVGLAPPEAPVSSGAGNGSFDSAGSASFVSACCSGDSSTGSGKDGVLTVSMVLIDSGADGCSLTAGGMTAVWESGAEAVAGTGAGIDVSTSRAGVAMVGVGEGARAGAGVEVDVETEWSA